MIHWWGPAEDKFMQKVSRQVELELPEDEEGQLVDKFQ